jgi:DNA-binding transcriptional ArsR family regulator
MVEYHPSALDDTYAALASDVRRAILARLLAGEARVTDVAEPFPISLAAVSKHIGVLERAGLVRRRIDGRTHWLEIDPGPLADAEAWIERTRAFWNGRLDALETMLRAEAAPTRRRRSR